MPMGAPAKVEQVGRLKLSGNGSGRRRRTRVAGVGLAHDIGRQGTDGGNGDVVGGLGGELGHGSKGRGMRGSLQ